jgi:hypothetical protein
VSAEAADDAAEQRRRDDRRRGQNPDRRSYGDAAPGAVLRWLLVLLDVNLAIGVLGDQGNVIGANELRRMQFKKNVVVRFGTGLVGIGSGIDENGSVASGPKGRHFPVRIPS